MPTLTWKNVVGQNTASGTQALSNAGSLFGAAFDKFTGVAKGAQADVETRNNAAITAQIKGLTTEADVVSGQDVFGQAALDEAFGAGNYDPNLATGALESQLGTVRQETTLQNNKLADEIASEFSPANDVAALAPAGTTALERFIALNPAENTGTISVNNGVVDKGSATPEQLAEFDRIFEEETTGKLGFNRIRSLAEQQREATAKFTAQGGTGAAQLSAIQDTIAATHNRNTLSDSAAGTLKGIIGGLEKDANLKIKTITDQAQVVLSQGPSIERKTGEAKTAAVKELITRLSGEGQFPDDAHRLWGPTLTGGNELTKGLINIFDEGIPLSNGTRAYPEAWQIENAVLSNSEESTSFFGAFDILDAGVDLKGVKDQLTQELNNSTSNQLDTQRLQSVIQHRDNEIAAVNKQLASDSANVTGLTNANAGVLSSNRNANFLLNAKSLKDNPEQYKQEYALRVTSDAIKANKLAAKDQSKLEVILKKAADEVSTTGDKKKVEDKLDAKIESKLKDDLADKKDDVKSSKDKPVTFTPSQQLRLDSWSSEITDIQTRLGTRGGFENATARSSGRRRLNELFDKRDALGRPIYKAAFDKTPEGIKQLKRKKRDGALWKWLYSNALDNYIEDQQKVNN